MLDDQPCPPGSPDLSGPSPVGTLRLLPVIRATDRSLTLVIEFLI